VEEADLLMPDSKPLASVIIPARNAAATMPRQLDALASQDFDGTWDVVVGENGSDDRTAALVRRRAENFPVPLRVVEVAHARGINAGRNAGASIADGERLLFCDADDVVSPTWVGALVSALDDADVAGGPVETKMLNSEKAQRRRTLDSPWFLGGLLFPIGANFACRAEVWQVLGGFDEAFAFGGWDEIEFLYRAQRHGYRVSTAPDALVHYQLRHDLRGFLRQSLGTGRGETLFRHKHPEFLPEWSPARECAQLARSIAGLLHRAVTNDSDRDEAMGYVALQIGRLEQSMAMAFHGFLTDWKPSLENE
jgi:glycosyltransferase involved in cell wall biosynthesis